MSEFKGTKGPWHHGEYGHVVNEFGTAVCQTFSKQEQDYANAKSNGKLIAAAPNLLKAANAAYTAIRHETNPSNSMLDAYNMLEQAIKKATE